MGHRGEVRATPGKVGRLGRFTPPRAPETPIRIRCSLHLRSAFPIHSFHSNLVVHLFTTNNKHLLSIYCVSDSVLGSEDTEGTEKVNLPALLEFTVWGKTEEKGDNTPGGDCW